MRRPPHAFFEGAASQRIWWIVATLLFCVAWISIFAWPGMLATATLAVSTSVAAEILVRFAMKRDQRFDGSAVVTGLIIALSLPLHAPPHITIISALFGVIVAKQLYGGLGRNFLNPAMAGRLFVELCWPFALATPLLPDAASTATPIGIVREALRNPSAASIGPFEAFRSSGLLQASSSIDHGFTDWINANVFSNLGIRIPDGYFDLFMGSFGGVPAILVLALSIVLLAKRIVSWRIAVSTIISYVLCSWVLGGLPYGQGLFAGDMLFDIAAGPMLFVAFFVATDPCTSPSLNSLKALYGAITGCLLYVLSPPSSGLYGAALAVLLGNCSALILDWLATERGKKRMYRIRESMRTEGMLK